MNEPDQRAETFLQRLETVLGGGEVDRLGFLDQRADPIDAPAFLQGAADPGHHFVDAAERDRARIDRLAAGRLFAQLGNIHVAEIGEHQGARDRRGGHHQHVDGLALAGKREPLVHAEAMLLVDHREREVAELDLVLEQRMGADQEVDVAGGKPRQDVAARAAALAPGQQRDLQAGGLRHRRDGGEVLPGQDLGRRHDGGLAAGLDHRRAGQQARRPSCPSRRRPAAGAACGAAGRDRPRCRPARGPATR